MKTIKHDPPDLFKSLPPAQRLFVTLELKVCEKQTTRNVKTQRRERDALEYTQTKGPLKAGLVPLEVASVQRGFPEMASLRFHLSSRQRKAELK